MTKQEALRRVRQAKSAHIRWRAYAQALIAGLDVDEEHAPVHHKSCDFGQWYYTDGMRAFGHWQVYRDIEDTHTLLHILYGKIYAACKDGQYRRGQEYLEQLIGISRTLLEAIRLLEEEIHASDAEVF